MNKEFILGFKIITTFFLVCSIKKYFLKTSMVLSAILLTIYIALGNSYGSRVMHHQILPLLAVYILAGFSLADKAFEKKNGDQENPKFNINSIPLVAFLFTTCLIYSFVGIHRIVYGGLDLYFTSRFTWSIIYTSYFPTAFFYKWHFGDFLLKHMWLTYPLNIPFLIVTIAEILAPLSIFSKNFRCLFLSVMIPFHILSWFLLNVFFWPNLLLYVIFFDFSRWPILKERKIQS